MFHFPEIDELFDQSLGIIENSVMVADSIMVSTTFN